MIIAINRFYAPDQAATSQLLTNLCEFLVEEGQSVTVIASRNSYEKYSKPLPANENIDGIIVRRVWSTRFGRYSLVGRSIDYLTFYVSCSIAILRFAKAGDVILAKTDPPLISVPAALAARVRKAHLVNWCQDLFPEVAGALGMKWADGPIGRRLCALRDRSLRRAKLNIVLSNGMRTKLENLGIKRENIRVIHNWTPVQITAQPRHRRLGDEPLTITYSGNLGRAHIAKDVINLVEASLSLPIQWRFVGGGTGYAKLHAHAKKQGWDHVRFEPYAEKHELDVSLANTDLHLVALDPKCEGLLVPSKIYGIMAAARPVLFFGSPSSEIAKLIKRHGCGVTIDSSTHDQFREQLDWVCSAHTHIDKMGNAAANAYHDHFSTERAKSLWHDVFNGFEQFAGAHRSVAREQQKTELAEQKLARVSSSINVD